MYRQIAFFPVRTVVLTEFLVPKAHLSLIEIADSDVQIHRFPVSILVEPLIALVGIPRPIPLPQRAATTLLSHRRFRPLFSYIRLQYVRLVEFV